MAYSKKEFKESNINYLNKDFDSFKANLNVVLDYYEEIEEYEKCSYTLELINKI